MSDPYVGEIRMFAGNYAPEGWTFCDGQLLSISEYEALFSLIGTTYGGDGQTNFGVPDLRGRLPVSMGTNPQTSTNFALATKAGAEAVTVTTTQLPAHTHTAAAQVAIGDQPSPANNVWAAVPTANLNLYSPTSSQNQPMAGGLLSPVGGSQQHDNMMPYLTVSFIISLYGIFPTQG